MQIKSLLYNSPNLRYFVLAAKETKESALDRKAEGYKFDHWYQGKKDSHGFMTSNTFFSSKLKSDKSKIQSLRLGGEEMNLG